MGFLTDHPETVDETMTELLDLYNNGKIKPVIDSVWPLEDVS